jgi:hypothetical protein
MTLRQPWSDDASASKVANRIDVQPRRTVIEQAGPLPSSRALAAIPAAAPLKRRQVYDAGNPYAPDWELEDYLRGAGLIPLNLKTACRKMDELAWMQRRPWSWYPLRDADRGLTGWRHAYPGRVDWKIGGDYANSGLAPAVYPHAIPETAWTLIRQIEQGFGQPIHFFISHYDARMPDPFLAATCTGHELYVIAEWQRPGRREPLVRRRAPQIELLGLPLKFWAFLTVVMVILWRVL